MEIKEIWKNIEEYPDYMVSNLGNVKSLNYRRTDKERILKQGINKNGYLFVFLSKEGKKKNYYVHRLVATHFLPNPDNLPEVNHKSEVKTNNCVDNLEWCTQEYNINYGTRNERSSKAHKGMKHTQETKDKIVKAKKGKPNLALKGKKLSQEWKNKIAKSNSKPILQFNREGTKILGKWESAKQAGNELNIFATTITACCRGKLKVVGGYRWMYLEDYVNRMEKLYQMVLKKAS